MNFTHYDLGYLTQGDIVEITLKGNAANVQLMDNMNFQNYKNGRSFKFLGGHVTTSLTNLPIPNNDYWHIAIDLGGYAGSVESSVRVL